MFNSRKETDEFIVHSRKILLYLGNIIGTIFII